ncbi:hypothetical protein C8R46DRAFT_1034855 [Mycena filopes]|nr:hypothetical protein C8R46DRAFT_1034855 [Mycena filopes]
MWCHYEGGETLTSKVIASDSRAPHYSGGGAEVAEAEMTQHHRGLRGGCVKGPQAEEGRMKEGCVRRRILGLFHSQMTFLAYMVSTWTNGKPGKSGAECGSTRSAFRYALFRVCLSELRQSGGGRVAELAESSGAPVKQLELSNGNTSHQMAIPLRKEVTMLTAIAEPHACDGFPILRYDTSAGKDVPESTTAERKWDYGLVVAIVICGGWMEIRRAEKPGRRSLKMEPRNVALTLCASFFNSDRHVGSPGKGCVIETVSVLNRKTLVSFHQHFIIGLVEFSGPELHGRRYMETEVQQNLLGNCVWAGEESVYGFRSIQAPPAGPLPRNVQCCIIDSPSR